MGGSSENSNQKTTIQRTDEELSMSSQEGDCDGRESERNEKSFRSRQLTQHLKIVPKKIYRVKIFGVFFNR